VLALAAAIVAVIVVLVSAGGGSGKGGAKPAAAAKKAKTSSNGARPPAKPAGRIVPHHRTPVPVLMYHVVGDPGPGQPNVSLFVSETEFRAQIAWLRDHGYHAVTLQQAYDFWKSGVALPPKPVVISFDDGYLGQFTHAFPVMQSLHWPGVLNLKVGNIGKTGIEKSEVKQMVAAGWEVDAHTITHPDLTTVGPAQLQTEIAGSKAKLKALFGVPVNFFCYPAGRFNATVVAAVKAAGYLGATTTMPGFASPKQGFYTLDRVRIDRGDGANGLATKLASRGAGISAGGE
jgi:peptidoglycan/xylan/chitin deacetylase (PgdA/CDA1 family)